MACNTAERIVTTYSAAGRSVVHPSFSLRFGIFNGGQKHVPKTSLMRYCSTLL